MENATKALLIAAGVLIAVMIMSAGIYLFINYSSVAYQYEKDKYAQNQIQYNNKFEKFVDKKLTPQDVITIVNLAKEYNENKSAYPMSVKLGSEDALRKFGENKNVIDFLDEGTANEYKYKIEILKDDNNVIKQIYINKDIT